MPWTALALIFTLIALLFLLIRRLYTYWRRRNVPHESPVFPLGHLQNVGKTLHFRDVNRRIYKIFKGTTPFTGMYFTFKNVAMILDLELIKRVLIKDFANFHDRGIFSNPRDDPLSGHLFVLDGEQWRSLRTKLTPAFTSGKMKFMFPTIVDVSHNLVDCCKSLLAAGVHDNRANDNHNDDNDGDGNGDGDVLDLKEICARYTTDVIGTCAFGLECNSLKDPNAEFRQMGRAIFTETPNLIVQTFMVAFPKLAIALHMKFFTDKLTKFFLNAVRTTVEYRIQNNVKRNDFMDILIEMKAEKEEAARQNDGIDLSQGLTIEQMAAQAFVFFFAGFETSSATMSFCLFELASHQDIQRKLRAEINDVLEKHNGELTHEAIKEMIYLDNVFNETLRKYSVVPHLTRITKADYKIPDTDYIIEAGTPIIIPVDAMQHDEEYFPDPERFDPSRFEANNVEKRHPMTFIPFGDGPRNCIGLRFGQMQSKIGLINLLKNYEFSKSSKTEDPIQFDVRSFIIAAKNGIRLRVKAVQ